MKPPKSPVFEETYKNYLTQVSRIDFKSIADKLGVKVEKNNIVIPLLNQLFSITDENIIAPSGNPPPIEISIVLCKYLLLCPEGYPKESEWVAFRDFKDSGPLTVFFANDVEQQIANHFSGKLKALEKAGKNLGGFSPDADFPYDLSMQFTLLPRIPLLMLFNDTDDEFGAKCAILFQKHAEQYLDAECLAITGALLTSCLKQEEKVLL